MRQFMIAGITGKSNATRTLAIIKKPAPAARPAGRPAAPPARPAPAAPKAAPRPAAPPPRPTPPHAAPIATAALPPRRPGRPSAERLAAEQALNGGDDNTGAPLAPARPAAPGLTVAQAAELREQIAALTETIKEQTETIRTLKNKELQLVRTYEAIIADAEAGIDEDDWRHAYHNTAIVLFHPTWDKGANNVTGRDESVSYEALLAFPRTADPGGQGSAARSHRMIAAWTVKREDGTYEGPPAYLSEADLNAIRAD